MATTLRCSMCDLRSSPQSSPLAAIGARPVRVGGCASPSRPQPVVWVATRSASMRAKKAPSSPRVQPPQAPPPSLDDGDRAAISRIVDEASRAHGVDRALVHAIILAESGYDPEAVSASVGATGLMQLMPDDAPRELRRQPIPSTPRRTCSGGVKLPEAACLSQFDGDIELALAAYNAGPGNVARAGNKIPQNPQTLAFVPKVLGYYRHIKDTRTRG